MTAFYTLSAIAVAMVDLGHHLTDLKIEPQPIGITIFSGHIDARVIYFDLMACILGPTEPNSRLLTWLDEHVPPKGASIAGFEIGAGVAPMLRPLSETRTSYGIDVLEGRRGRKLIDIDRPRRRAPR